VLGGSTNSKKSGVALRLPPQPTFVHA